MARFNLVYLGFGLWSKGCPKSKHRGHEVDVNLFYEKNFYLLLQQYHHKFAGHAEHLASHLDHFVPSLFVISILITRSRTLYMINELPNVTINFCAEIDTLITSLQFVRTHRTMEDYRSLQ